MTSTHQTFKKTCAQIYLKEFVVKDDCSSYTLKMSKTL